MSRWGARSDHATGGSKANRLRYWATSSSISTPNLSRTFALLIFRKDSLCCSAVLEWMGLRFLYDWMPSARWWNDHKSRMHFTDVFPDLTSNFWVQKIMASLKIKSLWYLVSTLRAWNVPRRVAYKDRTWVGTSPAFCTAGSVPSKFHKFLPHEFSAFLASTHARFADLVNPGWQTKSSSDLLVHLVRLLVAVHATELLEGLELFHLHLLLLDLGLLGRARSGVATLPFFLAASLAFSISSSLFGRSTSI